jgi:hypothetical protein
MECLEVKRRELENIFQNNRKQKNENIVLEYKILPRLYIYVTQNFYIFIQIYFIFVYYLYNIQIVNQFSSYISFT